MAARRLSLTGSWLAYALSWESANMSAANSTFRIVNESIRNSALSNAYQNLTTANYSVLRMGKAFSAFMNASNAIVNNMLKARAVLANMQNAYMQNETKLSKCTLSNGTTYAEAVNSSIARLNRAESIATVGLSYAYLNETIAAKTNESSLISECIPLTSLPGIGLNIPGKYVLYAAAAVVAILALYSASKFLEARSIHALRSGQGETSAQDSSMGTPPEEETAAQPNGMENAGEPAGNAAGAEGKEESKPASSIEDEFYGWFEGFNKKQPEPKPAKEAKPKKA